MDDFYVENENQKAEFFEGAILQIAGFQMKSGKLMK
jgi:hypothetical protein